MFYETNPIWRDGGTSRNLISIDLTLGGRTIATLILEPDGTIIIEPEGTHDA